MTTLLEFREKAKIFMGKYDIYIIPLLKFSLAIITFLAINGNIGFMERAKSPAISMILALMCSFLPINAIAVFGAFLIMAHAYALSLEVFAIAFVVIILMFLLFFRTASQYGYILVLTPLAFAVKMPYLVPLSMGLVGNPLAAVPVGCGTVIFYLMQYMKLNTTILSCTGKESEAMKQTITYLIDNVVRNREMLLMVIAFAVTIIVVYVIRRMSIDYAWSIAVGVGAVINVIVLLTGSMVLNVSLKIAPVLLGTLVSMALVMALQITVFTLDYSRTEYVQFEDDEYYYYVKAVPKVTIAVPEKRVKRISSQRKPASVRKKSSTGKKPAANPQHKNS